MKSLEALLRGYILFRVNDRSFLNYRAALRFRATVSERESCTMDGFHIIKGWRGFYYRRVQ